MAENTVRSKTRRDIAKAWIYIHLLIILASAVCIPIKETYAELYWNMASSTVMLSVTMAIVAFFFGGHVYSSHIKKK